MLNNSNKVISDPVADFIGEHGEIGEIEGRPFSPISPISPIYSLKWCQEKREYIGEVEEKRAEAPALDIWPKNRRGRKNGF
jgi:hypothetical protein